MKSIEMQKLNKLVSEIIITRFTISLSKMDEMIMRDPSNPNYYFKKATLLYSMSKKKAIDKNHKEAINTYYKAADLFMKQGVFIEALTTYKAILNIEPESVEANVNIKNILANFNECDSKKNTLSTPSQDISEFIKSISEVEFLTAFTYEEIERIISRANTIYYPDVSYVVKEGDLGDSLYIIKEGNASVVITYKGKSIKLARLMRGDIFGEIAFITGRIRTASVVTDGPLTVYELDKPLLEDMITENPEILDYLIKIYSIKVKSDIDKYKA